MKKQQNLNFAVAVMLVAIAFTFSAINVRAQPAIKVFKVGDRVEVNVANDIQNEDRWVKGTVTEIIYTGDGRLLSYKVKMDSSYVQQFHNLARLVRPLNDTGGQPSQTTPPQTAQASPPRATPAPTAAPKQADTNGDCSFDTYPEVKSSMKFSETFIKAELYERYKFEMNTGGLTSPLAVGLKFLNIQTGSPYTNTVTVVPGRGAQRKQDGAPVNEKIYPFKAKYIVCRKYSKEITRTQYESDFVCFLDRGGNWSCPVDGVPKITHLN
jgi:hypothetical protein